MALTPTEGQLAVYAVVAARRAQWDALVWQVPVLSLTAQAFLFTISLGAGDAWGRIISALLSLTIAVMSIMLMARHRQSEIHDANWLEKFEQDYVEHDFFEVHGLKFREERRKAKVEAGKIGSIIPLRPMFAWWVVGLSMFGLAAIAVILRSVFEGIA